MDTKTDTKPSLRMCLADLAFGVHLGVHSSPETDSATLYHRTCPGGFGAAALGPAAVATLGNTGGSEGHMSIHDEVVQHIVYRYAALEQVRLRGFSSNPRLEFLHSLKRRRRG